MKIVIKKVKERRPYLVVVRDERTIRIFIDPFFRQTLKSSTVRGRFYTKKEANEYRQKLIEQLMLEKLSPEG